MGDTFFLSFKPDLSNVFAVGLWGCGHRSSDVHKSTGMLAKIDRGDAIARYDEWHRAGDGCTRERIECEILVAGADVDGVASAAEVDRPDDARSRQKRQRVRRSGEPDGRAARSEDRSGIGEVGWSIDEYGGISGNCSGIGDAAIAIDENTVGRSSRDSSGIRDAAITVQEYSVNSP